jgi:hypothetical protein
VFVYIVTFHASARKLNIAQTVLLTLTTSANNDQHKRETSANMVCICLARRSRDGARALSLTTSTAVFIPSSNPLARRLGHRQCAPVAIPQTELPRRPERDDTYELAYQVIDRRHTAGHTTQDGLPFAGEGLTICP